MQGELFVFFFLKRKGALARELLYMEMEKSFFSAANAPIFIRFLAFKEGKI